MGMGGETQGTGRSRDYRSDRACRGQVCEVDGDTGPTKTRLGSDGMGSHRQRKVGLPRWKMGRCSAHNKLLAHDWVDIKIGGYTGELV